MKPVNFPQQNITYAKDQPEYLPLPAHRTHDGQVTAFWKCESWRERLRLFWRGGIYVTTHTFNRPLQPQRVTTEFTP